MKTATSRRRRSTVLPASRPRRRLNRVMACLFLMLPAGAALAMADAPAGGTGVDTRPVAAIAADPKARMVAAYGAVPLHFEANVGQAPDGIAYLAHGKGYALGLHDGAAASLHLRAGGPDGQTAALRMVPVNGNPEATARSEQPLAGRVNYLTGQDPAQWHRDIATHARVRYDGVYPGVDLVYYGNQGALEYDWVVAPGADPSVIRWKIDGTRAIELGATGDLLLHTAGGTLTQRAPVIYQLDADGRRQPVTGRYRLDAERQEVAFAVDAYDASRSLVIDPVLGYATFLGGSGFDNADDIALNADGEALIIGTTELADFKSFRGFGLLGGGADVFVARLTRDGGLAAMTFIGGSGADFGEAIAVDTDGEATIAGRTQSTNFPTLFPFATAPASVSSGVGFVARLSATGELRFSTYLDCQAPFDLAVDAWKRPILVGQKFGSCLGEIIPTRPASAQGDAYVIRMAADGSAVENLTFLGGNSIDIGYAVAAGPDGKVYVGGLTASDDIEGSTTLNPGGIGNSDAFVARLSADDLAVDYLTLIGGSDGSRNEAVNALVVNEQGEVYLAGQTGSADFPVVEPIMTCGAGGLDAFVARLAPSGAQLLQSTCYGGANDDLATGIAVDRLGQIYLSGGTNSFLPIVNPLAGFSDFQPAFLAKFSADGSALVSSHYFHGDFGNRIAVSRDGEVHISGSAGATNFTAVNPIQDFGGGAADAFVAKIVNPGEVAFDASTQLVGESGGTVTLAVTRNNADNGRVTVDYRTLPGTAGTGDFTAISGTLSWEIGDTSARFIEIPVSDDSSDEANESFTVELRNPFGIALGSPSTALVTVVDDDAPPAPANPGMVQFGTASFSSLEPAKGTSTATITVLRSGGSGPVSVRYATGNGSATAASDYDATAGELSWADGDTSTRTFTVTVHSDRLREANETVLLTLSNPTGGAALGVPNGAVLTIEEAAKSGKPAR